MTEDRRQMTEDGQQKRLVLEKSPRSGSTTKNSKFKTLMCHAVLFLHLTDKGNTFA